jgi:hypothetical protein
VRGGTSSRRQTTIAVTEDKCRGSGVHDHDRAGGAVIADEAAEQQAGKPAVSAGAGHQQINGVDEHFGGVALGNLALDLDPAGHPRDLGDRLFEQVIRR